MLRFGLTVTAVWLIAAGVLAGGPAAAQSAPDDSLRTAVGADAAARSDAWYRRGLTSLFARQRPEEEAATGADPQLARERFLPYAGLVIHRIHILGREAFGSVEVIGPDPLPAASPDSLVTRAGTFERTLNALAVPTRHAVIRNFLLFREGGLLLPDALADSERLLRREAYIRDALIVVLPHLDRPERTDVVVMVRDRWPWGVQGSVRSAAEQQVAIFHRNVGGLGLNLELELLHDRDHEPVDGWRTRTSATNLAGTFVDLGFDTHRTWDRDLTVIGADRHFSHPDLRLLGGWQHAIENRTALADLPPDLRLRSVVQDAWLGWNIHLRPRTGHGERRMRLVPAVRWRQVDFREAPLEYAPDERTWRDHRRYLLQLHLAGLDYYTASLVYGYGETEDLPVGVWAVLVGGHETGVLPDRLYHGARVIWPRLLAGRRYLVLEAALGSFRRDGRIEDGVLDLGAATFGPLRRSRLGAWRHFLQTRYTHGVNPGDPLALRLDAAALRDLDDERLAGNQRLVAELESVLFTPLAIIGFKLAAFGYAGGGLVAEGRQPLLAQRLESNAGIGLRLNNPGLVLPTIELRFGVLGGRDGWSPTATLRMGEVSFTQRRLPGVQPALLPYR